MSAELMYGQNPVMHIKDTIVSWVVMSWENEMSREELLDIRIRELEWRLEDLKLALERLETARLKNKGRPDKTHQSVPRRSKRSLDDCLQNNINNQHSSMRNFVRLWFGLYVVMSTNKNTTYHLVELNRIRLTVPIASKKVFISLTSWFLPLFRFYE